MMPVCLVWMLLPVVAFVQPPFASAEAVTQPSIDAVCREISGSHECAQAIEKAQLPRAGDRVRRRNGLLLVRLQSGRWAEFRDRGREADVSRFFFRECSGHVSKCIIFEQLWEDARYVVLDLRTGRRDTYHGQVAFSPNGRKFTVGGSWGYWGSDRLEIRDTATRRVEFGLGSPALLGLAKSQSDCVTNPTFLSTTVSASEVRWLSDELVEFRLMCMDAAGKWIKFPHRVAQGASVWQIVGVGRGGR